MLKYRIRTLTRLSIISLIAVLLAAPSIAMTGGPAPQKMTAEEVIAKHLEAIGTEEARSKIKSRVILGTAIGTIRVGGSGTSGGGSVMASQGSRNLMAVIYQNQEYPYEKMGFNGKGVTVAELKPGKYSELAKFFMTHEFPLREGLLGGTLSAAWPLLNASDKDFKVKYAGTKSIDDKKAHVLEFEGRDNDGLKTKLFFDAETFRHVRTEYEKRVTQQMPTAPGVTQQQGDAITKLVEEFGDFKIEGGLTFPHSYKLQLSIESLKRRALMDWVFTLTQFSFNRDIDDSQFDVKAPSSKT
jgi:hypothetical protein